ncbi:MAG: hypothetical protein ACK5NG_07845, partial [Chthoniobacterales bacterium]
MSGLSAEKQIFWCAFMAIDAEKDGLHSCTDQMKFERNFKTVILYLRRALFWKCPTCGVSPIFLPLLKTRGINDWTTPLDGCPRCGYAYEREPGYFLLSIWALSYGFGSLLGLILYLFLEWKYDL